MLIPYLFQAGVTLEIAKISQDQFELRIQITDQAHFKAFEAKFLGAGFSKDGIIKRMNLFIITKSCSVDALIFLNLVRDLYPKNFENQVQKIKRNTGLELKPNFFIPWCCLGMSVVAVALLMLHHQNKSQQYPGAIRCLFKFFNKTTRVSAETCLIKPKI